MCGKIYHSRQACPANLITYGLVPEQIVTQKKQLSFFKRWQVSPIEAHFSIFDRNTGSQIP